MPGGLEEDGRRTPVVMAQWTSLAVAMVLHDILVRGYVWNFSLDLLHWKKYVTIKTYSPGWCGSVDWVPACESKGCMFDSQSGHMPELQARSPVGDVQGATTHWYFFPSFSPPLFSLKKKKKIKKHKNIQMSLSWLEHHLDMPRLSVQSLVRAHTEATNEYISQWNNISFSLCLKSINYIHMLGIKLCF